MTRIIETKPKVTLNELMDNSHPATTEPLIVVI